MDMPMIFCGQMGEMCGPFDGPSFQQGSQPQPSPMGHMMSFPGDQSCGIIMEECTPTAAAQMQLAMHIQQQDCTSRGTGTPPLQMQVPMQQQDTCGQMPPMLNTGNQQLSVPEQGPSSPSRWGRQRGGRGSG